MGKGGGLLGSLIICVDDADDVLGHRERDGVAVRLLKSIGSKGMQPSHNTASKTQTKGQSFKKIQKAIKGGIG